MVLVYKNIKVLRDFFRKFSVEDSKVIVVNSYYDDVSLNLCQETALLNDADFIPIENKGFGYGNNVGTKYAMDNFEYDYLILSNSDIQINKFSYLDKIISDAVVLGPHTHLPNGKIQNPNIPWHIFCLMPFLYYAYKHNSRELLLITHAITRVSRELFRLYHKINKRESYRIYSCHGSFIIFTKRAVEALSPFFNEDMFLYNEELYLAEKCRIAGIPIYYCPKIDVLHLEGASSSGLKGAGIKFNKQSFMVLYEWIKLHKGINAK